MKKVHVVLYVLISLGLQAQGQKVQNGLDFKQADLFSFSQNQIKDSSLLSLNKHKSYDKPLGWLLSTAYAITKVGKEGVAWKGDFVTLFPDSLAECRINYADSLKYATKGTPGIGFVFDPYSVAFDPKLSQRLLYIRELNTAFSYRIDTLSIAGKYHIANYKEHSPDTLRIYLSFHRAYYRDPMIGTEYFRLTWMENTPYSGVSFICPIVEYYTDEQHPDSIPQKGSPVAPVAESTIAINYILSKKDTSDLDYKYIQIPVYYDVPMEAVLSVMVKFIPGYDYDVGEVLLQKEYDAQTKEWISTQYFQNTFDIATIEDTAYANFLDWGWGYNGRIMESMDVRYGIDTFLANTVFNPCGLRTYYPLCLPIPIVKLDISSHN